MAQMVKQGLGRLRGEARHRVLCELPPGQLWICRFGSWLHTMERGLSMRLFVAHRMWPTVTFTLGPYNLGWSPMLPRPPFPTPPFPSGPLLCPSLHPVPHAFFMFINQPDEEDPPENSAALGDGQGTR